MLYIIASWRVVLRAEAALSAPCLQPRPGEHRRRCREKLAPLERRRACAKAICRQLDGRMLRRRSQHGERGKNFRREPGRRAGTPSWCLAPE